MLISLALFFNLTIIKKQEKTSVRVGKKLERIKLPTALTIAALLMGIIFISAVFSTAPDYVIVGSSGTIVTMSPLHVEGNLIKDASGNTVYLRGVNKVEFADDPDGIWMGSTYWTDANVRAELAAMKGWGVNVIRLHLAVENWKYNLNAPYASISTRDAIERLLTFAGQDGIYVVLDGYRVTNYWHGGGQDPLPYPPYQTSANASSVIGSQQDFVDWWVSIASTLKGYPNVIFELWNEPYGNSTAKQSWFNVAQQTITAIRNTGATNLIVFQWDMAAWANLSFPNIVPANITGWIEQANLSDPLGNIVYSTHLYRSYGHIQYTVPTYRQAWNLSDVDKGLQAMGYYSVAAVHPLFIGEIGCSMSASDLSNETAFFNNALTLFDQHGISYAAFWWREIGVFRLHSGQPNFTPNQAGQILETHLSANP